MSSDILLPSELRGAELREQWDLFQVLDVHGWNRKILEGQVPGIRPREEESWLFPALTDHQRHNRYSAAM